VHSKSPVNNFSRISPPIYRDFDQSIAEKEKLIFPAFLQSLLPVTTEDRKRGKMRIFECPPISVEFAHRHWSVIGW